MTVCSLPHSMVSFLAFVVHFLDSISLYSPDVRIIGVCHHTYLPLFLLREHNVEYLVVGYYLPCTSPCYSGWQNTPSVSNTWGLLSSGIHEDHVFIKEEIVSKYCELKFWPCFVSGLITTCLWAKQRKRLLGMDTRMSSQPGLGVCIDKIHLDTWIWSWFQEFPAMSWLETWKNEFI